jgi:hypothetical protein
MAALASLLRLRSFIAAHFCGCTLLWLKAAFGYFAAAVFEAS